MWETQSGFNNLISCVGVVRANLESGISNKQCNNNLICFPFLLSHSTTKVGARSARNFKKWWNIVENLQFLQIIMMILFFFKEWTISNFAGLKYSYTLKQNKYQKNEEKIGNLLKVKNSVYSYIFLSSFHINTIMMSKILQNNKRYISTRYSVLELWGFLYSVKSFFKNIRFGYKRQEQKNTKKHWPDYFNVPFFSNFSFWLHHHNTHTSLQNAIHCLPPSFGPFGARHPC